MMNIRELFHDCSNVYHFALWNGEEPYEALISCFDGIVITENVLRVADYFGLREAVELLTWNGGECQ
jgi:hypothetical protein